MDFATIYRLAMRDRAPVLYRQLSETGLLHAHVEQKAEEARLRLGAFVEANGFENDLVGRRTVEEIVLHELLDPLTQNGDGPTDEGRRQWEEIHAGARTIEVRPPHSEGPLVPFDVSASAANPHEFSSRDDGAPDAYDCFGCQTGAAIRRFARARYATMARKIVYHLRRSKASGFYCVSVPHRTLWDEYCHEVQEGGFNEVIESIWKASLGPFLAHEVGKIPPEEAALMTIGAVWELDRENEFGQLGPICEELMQECLDRKLHELAAAHDMSRFDPS